MDVKGTPKGKRVLMVGGGRPVRDRVIAQAVAQGTPKPSILERLARAVEPKPEEKPRAKSQARLIKQMKDIDQAKEIYKPGETARPTNAVIASMDQRDAYRFYTDGSLRGVQRKPTREERNARKKARRHQLRFAGQTK